MTTYTRCVVLAQSAANMALRQKCSKVWLYFTWKDDNTVACNTCKVSISSKGEQPPVRRNIWSHCNSFAGLSCVDTLLLSDVSETSSSRANRTPSVSNAEGNFKLSRQTGLCLFSLAPFHCVNFYYTNNFHCHCPLNSDDVDGQSLAGSEAAAALVHL